MIYYVIKLGDVYFDHISEDIMTFAHKSTGVTQYHGKLDALEKINYIEDTTGVSCRLVRVYGKERNNR